MQVYPTASLLILYLACAIDSTLASPVPTSIRKQQNPDGKRIDRTSKIYPSSSKKKTKAPTFTTEARSGFHVMVEQKRRDKLAKLESAFNDIKANILSKAPTSLTSKEQLDIRMFRMTLQQDIDNYKRYKALPYLLEIQARLKGMKDRLTKYTDYIDRTNYEEKKSKRQREARYRYSIRRKEKKAGIDVASSSAAPKIESRPKEDDPPPRIKRHRVANRIFMKRKRERHRNDKLASPSSTNQKSVDLLSFGWGRKDYRD